MIRKLRWKIVAMSMAMVFSVLLAVFLAVLTTTRRSIQQDSIQVLQRVLRMEDQTVLPGLNGSGIQLPYFSVSVSGGVATVLSGSYYDLGDEQQLLDIINACLAEESSVGALPRYHMRYLRVENAYSTRIAFVDTSLEESTMRNLLWSSLQIGSLAFGLLLVLSILFARWAVRPVERTLEQQRQFISDASHELKTPLTVIISNADLLSGSPQAAEEEKRRWVDNVQSESYRMKRLVEEMLTLMRTEDLSRQPVMQRLDFGELVADSALLFEPVAFEAGKQLQYDVQQGSFVQGDADQLRQLCAILLDNAIKYAPAGACVELRLQNEGKKLKLQVYNPNDGDPIPPQRLQHLFDRFYRADSSRGESRGFGLGLAIAKSIAAGHKADLKVESDLRGTTFTAEFPRCK